MRGFTFYQLVRCSSGYRMRPYITIYPSMLEIRTYV